MNLHSTMYLLNLFEEGNGRVRCMYLHSTMYLLNPKSDNKVNLFSSIFTFHYVSIKSLTTLKHTTFSKLIYIPLCIY